MAATRWWDGSALVRRGYCEKTPSSVGDCASGGSGSFGLPQVTSTYAAAAAACQEACSRCSQCRFISYSLKWRDCTWHSECDLSRLHSDVADFRSEAGTNRTKGTKRVRRLSTLQRRPTMSWASDLAARWPVNALAVVQIGANDHSKTYMKGKDHDGFGAGGDPVPLLIAAGWRALLFEPIPYLFARLSERYRNQVPRVQCVPSAVGICAGGPLRLWGIDFTNVTGNWGTQRADARCFQDMPSSFSWVRELATGSRERLPFRYGRAFRPVDAGGPKEQPAACARCAARLHTSLPPDCLRLAIDENVQPTDTPCAGRGKLRRLLPNRNMSAAALLVIDVEGFDADALEVFPFESVQIWRVVFEATLLSAKDYARANRRLRSQGFRWVSGDRGMAGDHVVWHHLDAP